MYSEVKQRADKLVQDSEPAVFADRKIGLEKESLRVTRSGGISQADHPAALGAALSHPSITTDFSEALLEMVTPPSDSAEKALEYLTAVHQFIVHRLPAGEHIWNTSMPCILHGAESVRIGEYGSSHTGRMKHAYRRGLGLRYGRRMQAIAGVHFNFSMPESSWALRSKLLHNEPEKSSGYAALTCQRTEGYFQMMQNLLRIGWMVPYLFGASPAICTSFLADGEGEELELWNETTRYAPFGTSLRMGKIGYRYREDQPIDLSVRHTNIHEYIEDIIGHVSTAHPPYQAMGVRDADNEFQQLSVARLQIENEFYSAVRPKQIANSGELPIHALRERGIRYLELRSVDVNLLDQVGISLDQIAVLEMLMMFAWLGTPQPLSADEMARNVENVKAVAHHGRQPGLLLEGPNGSVDLQTWGSEILTSIRPIAQWLDQGRAAPLYVNALNRQMAKIEEPAMTPSAKIIDGIKQSGSFFEHSQELSREHDAALREATQNEQLMHELENMVEQSHRKQSELEAGNEGGFAEFLEAYLCQIQPGEVRS